MSSSISNFVRPSQPESVATIDRRERSERRDVGPREPSSFDGALERAHRDRRDDRAPRRDPHDTVDRPPSDTAPVEVVDARSRLRRTGHRVGTPQDQNADRAAESATEYRGVPRRTDDVPPGAIVLADDAANAPNAATRRLDSPRTSRNPAAKRWQTASMGAPAAPGTLPPQPAIPSPPVPGSARRISARKTLSYAVRNRAPGTPPPIPERFAKQRHPVSQSSTSIPAATQTRASPPPKRVVDTPTMATTPTTVTAVDDGEPTQVWSRQQITDATSVPPAPPWKGSDAPAPAMERLPALEEQARREAQAVGMPRRSEASSAPERDPGAQAIVNGPLRAYASAMSATPRGGAFDVSSQSTAAAKLQSTISEMGEAMAAVPPKTIGEPISAGLDIPTSAFEQLATAGVPAQSGPSVHGSAQGRTIADPLIATAASETPDVQTTVGRLGPNRAEVVVDAGDRQIGLAITTAGPHVMVEAQVPDDAMAHAMRHELDDLKAALSRHDLELSDLSFGESGDGPDSRGAANDSGAANGDVEDGDDNEYTDDAPQRSGVRIVA